jgi:5'-nucleotidase
MKRIALLALVLGVALAGCKKPATQAGSEVAAAERPLADLAPESATPAPQTAPPSQQPTKVTSLAEVPPEPSRTALAPAPASFRPVSPPAPVRPAAVAPTAGRTYVVQKGDSLWSIARKLYGDGKRSRDIAQANRLADPNKLKIGQVLTIP